MQDDGASIGSISFDQLQTLRAVAAAGTFTHAAATLYITQPAVTHRIRRLEEALGVELFRTSGRELELSEAGERALRFAEDVARLAVEFRSDLATLQLAPADRAITIASSESLLLPFFLNSGLSTTVPARRRAGTVDYLARDVAPAVAAGKADLGFEFSSDPAAGFTRVPILHDRVVLVVSGDEEVSNDPSENMRQVRRMSFLLPSSGKHSREVIEEWARLHQVQLRVALESHSYGVLLKAVGHHFSVAAMPERLIARRLALGELRTVPLPGFPHDFLISLIAAGPPRAGAQAGAVREFLQVARDPAWRAPLPPELASVTFAPVAAAHPRAS